MTIQQIINKVKANDPKVDTTLLELAYEFADKAHASQKRKSGEPYIQHSLHTAFLLTQIGADINTVIAGLLHDVPEDSEEYTLEDIKNNFGGEVAFLVEGITKLSKIKYRGVERYRESLRKMFLAMAQDVRVVLIKFCDRLHNLRTLDALPEEKRKQIAQETMEIYAPIAGLLGVWRLKWQMEDICFKYLYPDDFKQLQYKYEVEKKMERNQFTQKITDILKPELAKAGIHFLIEYRFKHLYSIWQKMQRKDRRFDEIYDVFAIRVIVDSVSDCYKTLGVIHSIWKPMQDRMKDYIAMPKPNGYRSLHTTVYGPDNKATEFQIRTREMHNESLYGIAAHWHYKHGKFVMQNEDNQPAWIKEILVKLRTAENTTTDIIKDIKVDVFRNRIFVFTPKGDVFDLPENATPIDFAYAVHTEVGDKAIGCLINNKMSPLDTPLKNGDMVEIIIEKKRKGPSQDWLRFVKTQRARDKIKHATSVSRLEKLKRLIPGI